MNTIKKNKLFLYLFILYISLFIFFSLKSFAQENPFTVNGYVDTYYSYDTDRNGNILRQFSAAAPARDKFRINLAQLTGKYSSDNLRSTVTLQFGDIPKYNWPQPPNEYLQYIQEANAGFSPAKNLWFDFGFYLTHIGAEGILPINNFASTLALPTYYEPFYQSGIKVSYDFSPKVYGSFHLLNGYNVFADNNKNKSAGVQLGIKPSSNLEIIYNNLIGNEQPAGSESKVRIFNNLVFKIAASKKLDVIFGGDLAMQEKSKLSDSTSSAVMYGALLSFKYKFHPKFSGYLRGEIINDNEGFLTGVFAGANGEISGLKANGITFGLEHRPRDNAYIRIESRMVNADSNIKIFFDNDRIPSNTRIEAVMSAGIAF